MRTFIALELALNTIRLLRPILERIEKHDPRHAAQIRDAASSAPMNLAEGNRRKGRDRTYRFSIAAGSADEVRAGLRVAEAWGWVTTGEIQEALAHIDRLLGMIHGLTH